MMVMVMVVVVWSSRGRGAMTAPTFSPLPTKKRGEDRRDTRRRRRGGAIVAVTARCRCRRVRKAALGGHRCGLLLLQVKAQS